jgi:hypothetical protein
MPVRLLSDAGVAAASPSLIDELTDEIAEHVRLLVDRRRRRPPTPAQHEHINFHGTYNLDAESGLRCRTPAAAFTSRLSYRDTAGGTPSPRPRRPLDRLLD